MGLIAKDRISHIVVMRHLHIVEQDHVFQLRGVAHHAVIAHQCAAPDKGALTNLRPVADDAGAVEIGGLEHRCVLGHPDILQNVAVPVGGVHILVLRKLLADLQNQVGDPGQRLPWIGELLQVISRQRMAQII